SRANPLPIELMHFGVSQTNNKVVATWQTATEINNDFFTLEKSTDLKTWEIISTVQGAGNSNVTLEYSTLDDNPIQGVNYYQLKQTDSDGKFTYSKIASINFKVSDLKDDRLNIFPNPTNGQAINVAMNNMNGMFDLKVINILGEEIYSESNYVYKETGLKSIHFQNKLSSGIYHVIMVSESSITTQSFIVN
ncbi:MAG: T9SS type A sorting domain-containing protein, partial [Bacteroidia bacterium]|nr:T9SS type A sorting domain-containing protein [Bacteroidia bacterium]